jgi:hypothetical protein
MNNRFLASGALAPLLVLALLAPERAARAEDPRPVVVEYVAPLPPECASVDAFQATIAAEVARGPRARSDWQFAVRVVPGEGGYTGTLTSGATVRTVHGRTCDDTTSALAHLIAGTESEAAARPPPPSEAPSPGAPPPPAVDEASSSPGHDSKAAWRLGGRFQAWTHGAAAYGSSGAMSLGGVGLLSVEFPWGIFHKTMFEVAAGAMDSSSPGAHLTYYVVDTQACPFDLALGGSGLSLLGCLRLAGAWFKATDSYGPEPGGALWFGAGARLRWQSTGAVFLEGHLNAVYGTVSGPEVNDPAWLDIGATLGVRL